MGRVSQWVLVYPHGRPALQSRHNEHDGVSKHQTYDCLLDRLFRSKNTSKLRVTGLCAGNLPVTGESPHKGPVTRKMFPFDDVIMSTVERVSMALCLHQRQVLLPPLLFTTVGHVQCDWGSLTSMNEFHDWFSTVFKKSQLFYLLRKTIFDIILLIPVVVLHEFHRSNAFGFISKRIRPRNTRVQHMMTSSNGNILRVTGPLCVEFTGPRWIPLTKASNTELWYFLWSAPQSTVE